MKNIRKLDYTKTIDQKSIFKLEQLQMHKMDRAQQKQEIITFCSLVLLGIWVAICFNYYNYFLKDALISTAIIGLVVFLRSTNNTSDNFSNQKN